MFDVSHLAAWSESDSGPRLSVISQRPTPVNEPSRDAFLEAIKSFCNEHGLAEKSKRTSRDKNDQGRRYFLVGEAYNAGETVENLMVRYRVTAGTILGHLTRYLSAGNTLRNGEDLQAMTSATPEQQRAAFAAFNELSPAFLKPVYDKLNGELNYDELKILRMLYLISQQG